MQYNQGTEIYSTIQHNHLYLYDYADGVTFALSEFTDGGIAETFVADKTGKRTMQVRAERSGSTITLTVTGGGHWDCRMLADHEISDEKTATGAVITLLN